MADIQHENITDPNLHEPKGASTASDGSVYISDGAGSGDWEFTEYALNCVITDVSTPGSYWVVAPRTGTIEKVYTVLHGTIAGANSVVTPKIGGVSVTNGAVTVAYDGSAAGDVDSATPTAANTVSAGGAIEIATDGASTNTVAVTVTLLIKRTA